MNNLKTLLKTFINTPGGKLQLDFFRNNGEVLFQVFKQANWIELYELTDYKGYIINIIFSKSKTDNKKSFMRFENSKLFSLFEKKDFYKQEAYFMGVSSQENFDDFYNLLTNLTKDVFEVESYYYTLNEY